MPAILRVRRKRSQKLADALLVISKSNKREASNSKKSQVQPTLSTERNVFVYAITIASVLPLTSAVREKVRNAILKQQQLRQQLAQIKYKQKQTQSVRHPVKLSLSEEVTVGSIEDKLKSTTLSHHQAEDKRAPASQPLNQRRSNSSFSSSKWPSVFRKSSASGHCSTKHTIQSLKVNSKQMKSESKIRSKSFSQQRSVETSSRVDEFVSDFYYCQNASGNTVREILLIKPCSYTDMLSKTETSTAKTMTKKKPKKHSRKSSSRKIGGHHCADEDSVDEDEKRYIFDEEEDCYDSDEPDMTSRDDSDAFSSYFDSYNDSSADAIDYEDNLVNEMNFDQDLDYGNDAISDVFGADDADN